MCDCRGRARARHAFGTPTMRRTVVALLLAWCSVAYAPRTGRDWSKLTDADWDRIEKEWETPEEEEEYAYKPPKSPGVDMEKLKKLKGKKLEQYMQRSQQSSGPTMMFATLDYEGCCVKKKTEEIGNRWASMLRSSGMDITMYVIDDDQVLFSSQAGLHAHEIHDYVLTQKECVSVEWNSKRTVGPAETPEWRARDEEKKAAKKAINDAKEAEAAAVKKAEAKARKAKKKARRKAAQDTKEL